MLVDAHALAPEAHLRMQAALQPFIENAISKTINIPEDFDFAGYRSVYERAHELGLKGCTTFHPNPVTGSVLSEIQPPAGTIHCCSLERTGLTIRSTQFVSLMAPYNADTGCRVR